MKILNYVDKRYVQAAMEVAPGADLLISPPMLDIYVQPKMLEGYDFIYIDLHGEAGREWLMSEVEDGNDSRSYLALSADKVECCKLENTIVFATSCFLPETPFIQAFITAGAKAVVAGQGINFGGRKRIIGAQVLARNLIEELERPDRENLDKVLEKAKTNMMGYLMVFDQNTIKDTLQFEIFRKRFNRENV